MNLREAQAMAESKSERVNLPRDSWGSLIFGPPNPKGLCPKGKCCLKAGHLGDCWPNK